MRTTREQNRSAGAICRPPSGWLGLLLAALAASSATSLLLPAALAAAADRLVSARPAAAPTLAVVGLLAAGVLAEVAAGVASAACTSIATARARRGMLDSVFVLGVSGRARFGAGDLVSRLVGNCANVGQCPAAIASAAVAAVTSLLAAAALWRIDPWLGATFLAGMVPVLLLVRVFMRRASGLFARYQAIQGQISTRLADALAGIRTIRASGTAEREIKRILVPLAELSATGRQTWQAQRSVVWRLSLAGPMIELVMLAVAGIEVASGRIPAGDLLATAGYTALALGFIDQIDSVSELALARAGARRVGEVHAAAAALPPRGDQQLTTGPGLLELRGVTVRADGGRTVLDRIWLTVAPGSTVALVGPSGAGKTTLARLVGRLAEPDEGEVLVDGVPVAGVDAMALRREIAYAFERPVLLGDTVYEAVTYAAPETTRERAVRAAELARADTFIRRLPQGYDTPIRGLALSGGEAQRLGLARALTQRSRVLVFDDATSSLDTVTEMQISRALTTALAGRTRLVIAQRASTAQRADLVAWLDKGRLRAIAPHEQLWQEPDYQAVFNGNPAT